MTRRMRWQSGQSTVEYAVLIGVLVAAAVAMQIYVKRGTMGKLRDASDQIGEQFDPRATNTTVPFDNSYAVTRNETTSESGETTSTFDGTTLGSAAEVRTRTQGKEEVTAFTETDTLF